MRIPTAFLILAVLLALAPPCRAGDTLDSVRGRGVLRCGVGGSSPGLSLRAPDGAWSGMDVDFCRAVAAAVLENPDKVAFVPLSPPARFASLKAREIDLLSRNTSWTLNRAAFIGVDFVGPILFTGLGVMVRKDAGIKEFKGLADCAVCLSRGSTHLDTMAETAARLGITVSQVLFEDVEQALAAYLQGQCQALADDEMALNTRLATLPDRDQQLVLPGPWARELLSPVVRQGDDQWSLIVQAVRAALLHAEATGLTRDKVLAGAAFNPDVVTRTMLARSETLCKPLGLKPGWMYRVIGAVGNYEEMFERNLGSQSPSKLERGSNALWNKGGILYAPPF